MVKYHDWSELTTINYIGGFCGEFFALLLHEALSKHDNPTHDCKLENCWIPKSWLLNNQVNRHDFSALCVFNCKPKSLNIIRYILQNIDIPSYGFQDTRYYDWHVKFCNIYLSDCDDISLTLRSYYYNNYKQNFNGDNKIGIFHNQNNKLFSLQDIFPKSKNIFLTSKLPFYYVARSMSFLKDVQLKTELINSVKKGLGDTLSNKKSYFNMLFDESPFSNVNNEYEIDIFQLVFESEHNANIQLSEYFGLDIKLNKDRIEDYKNKNILLLNQYGIDPYKDYTKQYFVDTAIKNFL